MEKTLYLIDGHALIFKMYYAFVRRPMMNSKGVDTSILFGFMKYLLELLDKRKPTHVAVSFDLHGPTFRHLEYPEYKANRSETPEAVREALEPLQKMLKLLRIPEISQVGFEADDMIGSMAKRAEREGFKVYMVTPDKDYGQLITENIFQYKPGKAGSDDEILGPAEICEKYGIDRPEQVIDMLTICGDSSDNVPGVKGVGEVGAGKLIKEYGSVDNIYAHLDGLKPKQREAFENARDHINLSHWLVTIKTDIDIAVATEDMAWNDEFDPEIVKIFDEYEFGSLKKFIRHIHYQPAADETPGVSTDYMNVSPAQLAKVAEAIGRISVVRKNSLLCCAVANPVIAAQTSENSPANAAHAVAEGKIADFAYILGNASVSKAGWDLKKLYKDCRAEGISLEGRLEDIELMHYLINPEKSHKVEVLAKGYLGVNLEETVQPAAESTLFDILDDDENAYDFGKEAVATALLAEKVWEDVEELGHGELYLKMEEPLVRVLGNMEMRGVKVDIRQLDVFAGVLRKELEQLQTEIRELAGEPSLNISSPKQIGTVIYEKLNLNPKVKPGQKYSTDEETLSSLADKHPIVNKILEFRGVHKLLSTYIEPFPNFINPQTGKVHTTFNQALTATGRLSSSKPNLQNIPIRTERGKEIRRAFVPSNPGGIIVSADYSQIELRIMAHLSCDSHLIEAFRSGKDVHKATAAKIYGVPLEEVTADMRRSAKTANFGIMYGISSFGLSQRLGTDRKSAKQLIDDYFANFPAISAFISDTIAHAKESGYVETLFGRRRYVPEINSHNGTVRALAERNAVNAPIQGTSADIIKLAMIAVEHAIEAEGLKSRMVLQIHDELLFDAVPEEIDRLKEIVIREMEHVCELSVPLDVECNSGENWLEAH